MGALVWLFVVIGIACGVCLAIVMVINALLKSNNIGEKQENDTIYIDRETVVYHARYDSGDEKNYFDGYYK